MRMRIISTLTVAGLLISACGSSGGGAQDDVADMFVEVMAEDDITIDADCAREEASKLSDDDAQKIVDAGPDGDPDISLDADEVAAGFARCVDTDSLVDSMIGDLKDQFGDDSVDADCLKDALRGVDLADASQATALSDAVGECVSFG